VLAGHSNLAASRLLCWQSNSCKANRSSAILLPNTPSARQQNLYVWNSLMSSRNITHPPLNLMLH